MKKLFTLFAVCASAFAVHTASAGSLGRTATAGYVQKSISTSQFTSHSASRALACDTLLNVSATADTPVYYRLQSPGGGYLSGNGALTDGTNAFPIGGVAEHYTTPNTGMYATSALVFFGKSVIKSTDSAKLIKAYVYDTTGTGLFGGFGPGAARDSASVTLRTISQDITNQNPTIFNFTHQAALPGRGLFITIALPLVTGDTIVVLSNTQSVHRGDGWVNLPTGGGWVSYDSIFGSPQGLFIIATVCSNVASCPTITTTATQIGTSGSAYATATGGATPYTYAWSNGRNTDTITGLAPGVYTVTVTDRNGCTGSASVTINNSTCPTITTNATQIGTTGSAYATATGGATPYAYAWSNGSNNDTITGLAAGQYRVTVTDRNGCTGSASVTINAASCPTITATATQVSGSNTSASVVASGGTGPYRYSWNTTPVQTNDTAIGLIPTHVYNVTVTDVNGCAGSTSITIRALGVQSITGVTQLSIYPNPSNGVFTASVSLEAASDVTISVSDMTGNRVFESTDKAVKELTKPISLNAIAAGVYIVNVKTAGGSANTRIIIK